MKRSGRLESSEGEGQVRNEWKGDNTAGERGSVRWAQEVVGDLGQTL